jgi:hypothetical protein
MGERSPSEKALRAIARTVVIFLTKISPRFNAWLASRDFEKILISHGFKEIRPGARAKDD